MVGDGEEVRFDWRRGGAAGAGLVAALVLVVMVFAVKFANDAREKALDAERQANQVALVVRNVSANVAKADAALARFTLDEDVKGSGNVYANAWQFAGYQIAQLKALERGNPAHHGMHELACAQALLGHPRQAVAWLRKATQSGLPNYVLFLRDPFLDSLRSDPEFIELMAGLKADWERRLQEYQ